MKLYKIQYIMHYHINCYDLVTNTHYRYLPSKWLQQLEGGSSVIIGSLMERKTKIKKLITRTIKIIKKIKKII